MNNYKQSTKVDRQAISEEKKLFHVISPSNQVKLLGVGSKSIFKVKLTYQEELEEFQNQQIN